MNVSNTTEIFITLGSESFYYFNVLLIINFIILRNFGIAKRIFEKLASDYSVPRPSSLRSCYPLILMVNGPVFQGNFMFRGRYFHVQEVFTSYFVNVVSIIAFSANSSIFKPDFISYLVQVVYNQ